jgi:tetratricopeptide (TPR) repeat protein
VPTLLETVVDEAITHLTKKEYGKAEALLEGYENYYRPDVGYHSLLGIAQAAGKNYGKAKDTFESLIVRFEHHPTIIFTVRDRIRPLFETESYKDLKKTLLDYATQKLPVDLTDLYAVFGFLCLAEQKYNEAAQAFRRILPKHAHKKEKYREIMQRLVRHSEEGADIISKNGYELVSEVFK